MGTPRSRTPAAVHWFSERHPDDARRSGRETWDNTLAIAKSFTCMRPAIARKTPPLYCTTAGNPSTVALTASGRAVWIVSAK